MRSGIEQQACHQWHDKHYGDLEDFHFGLTGKYFRGKENVHSAEQLLFESLHGNFGSICTEGVLIPIPFKSGGNSVPFPQDQSSTNTWWILPWHFPCAYRRAGNSGEPMGKNIAKSFPFNTGELL